MLLEKIRIWSLPKKSSSKTSTRGCFKPYPYVSNQIEKICCRIEYFHIQNNGDFIVHNYALVFASFYQRHANFCCKDKALSKLNVS